MTEPLHAASVARQRAPWPVLMLTACASLLLCCSAERAAARTATSTCPLNCGDAALAWCETTFGRGGNLSVADCGEGDDASFRCVCNDASSVKVEISVDGQSQTAVCNWTNQVFEMIPGGEYCTPTTGLCPSSCGDIDDFFCETARECTEDEKTGFYNFSCTTCQGRVVTITGTNESCDKHYSSSIPCNPATTCSGHGCCTRPTSDPFPVCTCFANKTHGFWQPPQCAQCASGYDRNKDCREPTATKNIVYVLSSIATTWTMLCPNLAVLVLFVILGLARRLWDSDRSFTLTALRRAHLAPVQTARRNQQSLFHSKYVPRRPAKSRCFLNEGPDSVRAGRVPRGPPAY